MKKAIYRILDANLDRAREGLRIIEEWCRLGLNHQPLAEECKDIRQELARWHSWELRQARDTPGDVGTDLSHPQEEARESIQQLLQANLCRSQEAFKSTRRIQQTLRYRYGNSPVNICVIVSTRLKVLYLTTIGSSSYRVQRCI